MYVVAESAINEVQSLASTGTSTKYDRLVCYIWTYVETRSILTVLYCTRTHHRGHCDSREKSYFRHIYTEACIITFYREGSWSAECGSTYKLLPCLCFAMSLFGQHHSDLRALVLRHPEFSTSYYMHCPSCCSLCDHWKESETDPLVITAQVC